MSDLETLPAKKLHALISKRDAHWKTTLDATIAAGMGEMRYSDIFELAKGSKLLHRVQIANDYLNARLDWRNALDELERRKAYHGSDKPIKRKSAY